jgi:hypothetical protein
MHDPKTEIGELNLSARQARRVMSTCIELLELCCNVSGKIDPAAGWMVAHARARVFESPSSEKLQSD